MDGAGGGIHAIDLDKDVRDRLRSDNFVESIYLPLT
jgi:hypothetical protein